MGKERRKSTTNMGSYHNDCCNRCSRSGTDACHIKEDQPACFKGRFYYVTKEAK